MSRFFKNPSGGASAPTPTILDNVSGAPSVTSREKNTAGETKEIKDDRAVVAVNGFIYLNAPIRPSDSKVKIKAIIKGVTNGMGLEGRKKQALRTALWTAVCEAYAKTPSAQVLSVSSLIQMPPPKTAVMIRGNVWRCPEAKSGEIIIRKLSVGVDPVYVSVPESYPGGNSS
ncbi:M [Dog Tick rhabdovirus-1]|nr:M [Dog Tick rhabdovirus-1] [Dog Tick rhabdovirus-1]